MVTNMPGAANEPAGDETTTETTTKETIIGGDSGEAPAGNAANTAG